MREYAFETFDVFTQDRFAGNPLAVIMDARGLSDDDMQTIAREFNLSETTFILPPDDPAHAARVRIFTPVYEMPFAGHPTVGTAIAIAKARGLSGEITLELNAGLFPVRVEINDATSFAEFQNPNLPAQIGEAPSADALEKALGLPPGALDRGNHAPRSVGAGVTFLYACASLEHVRQARVDSSAWAALALDKIVGVYLYAASGDSPEAAYHARMFAPDAGVLEDPATGSAAAALPGQLALAGAAPNGENRWQIEQGYEMGRPSQIYATAVAENGVIQSVRIGGYAVPVQSGRIAI